MEKLSDILASVKERATNPFVFSFVISWLICNWRVTYALLWYDVNEVHREGFSTVFDFIEAQTFEYGRPIWIAVGYTFGLPIIKNISSVFASAINAGGSWLSFKISKDSPVSVDRYMNLRINLRRKEEQVADLINTEEKRNALYNESQKQVIDIQAKLVDEQTQHLALKNVMVERHAENLRIFDFNLVQGRWTVDGIREGMIIHVKPDRTVDVYLGVPARALKRYSGRLTRYVYFREERAVLFVVVPESKEINRLYFDLIITRDNVGLTGHCNGDKVEMIRYDDIIVNESSNDGGDGKADNTVLNIN